MPRLTLKRKKNSKKDQTAQQEKSLPAKPTTEAAKTAEVSSNDDKDMKAPQLPATQEVKLDAHDEKQPEAFEEKPETHEDSTEEPKVTELCLPNQEWEAIYEAVAGLSHRDARPPLPCQDAAVASASPRPWALVADGAGSSAVSEIGSQAVVTGLSRLATTLEKQIGALLDSAEQPAEEAGRNLGLLFVKHAKGILDDLAVVHRRPQKDFRCTLLMAIQGKNHLLWVKIGDGALVAEQMSKQGDQLYPELRTLGEVGKGEFANQTTFIDDHLQPSDVQVGIEPSQKLTGFAAMSDGAADRLVANNGREVSSQVSGWLHQLRQGKLKRRALTRLFYSDAFTQGTTGDDASIALVASGLKEAHE